MDEERTAIYAYAWIHNFSPTRLHFKRICSSYIPYLVTDSVIELEIDELEPDTESNLDRVKDKINQLLARGGTIQIGSVNDQMEGGPPDVPPPTDEAWVAELDFWEEILQREIEVTKFTW